MKSFVILKATCQTDNKTRTGSYLRARSIRPMKPYIGLGQFEGILRHMHNAGIS